MGWLAPLVGVLIGLGVGSVSRGGRRSPVTAGALATLATLVVVLVAEFAVIQAMVPDGPELTDMFLEGAVTEELLISYVADDVVAEATGEGRSVDFPAGVDPGAAVDRSEYPPEIWAEAERRWASMAGAERAGLREEVSERARETIRARRPELRRELVHRTFVGTLAGGHLPFVGLALLAAFGAAALRTRLPGGVTDELREAVKLAMVEVMIADGKTDPEEVDVVREAFAQVAGARLPERELVREIRAVRSGEKDVPELLEGLAADFDEEARRLVVTAAIVVATTDAEIQEVEHDRIWSIVEALGMTPGEFDRLIIELSEQDGGGGRGI